MMIYYDNTHVKAGDESRRAIEARHEREARERITEEFVALLSLDPDEGARWTGTVTDLMEATHIAYTQGTICDSEGNTCTFTQLVTGICDTLHVKRPRNPAGCAYQAAQRKGVRKNSLIYRYMRQMFHSAVEKPLSSKVIK